MPSALQHELRQRRPFQSAAHEAVVGLMRTADLIKRQAAAIVEPHGITLQQFNVLRILRGAGADGLPTLEVADRMIEQTPGVTRLLDRMEAKGLVKSRVGEPTTERGGRAKRHFQITKRGVVAVNRTHEALRNMSKGLSAVRSFA